MKIAFLVDKLILKNQDVSSLMQHIPMLDQSDATASADVFVLTAAEIIKFNNAVYDFIFMLWVDPNDQLQIKIVKNPLDFLAFRQHKDAYHMGDEEKVVFSRDRQFNQYDWRELVK